MKTVQCLSTKLPGLKITVLAANQPINLIVTDLTAQRPLAKSQKSLWSMKLDGWHCVTVAKREIHPCVMEPILKDKFKILYDEKAKKRITRHNSD